MGGLTLIAVMMQVIALGWSILWFLGLGEAVSSSNGAVLFLLLVSYYWVHQVLSNVVHVTSAGTVATWWFVPFEAASYWSKAVRDSFSRATTYSFGSICFGSLLVAIVQSLRAIAHMARDNEDAKIILCVIECILALIQDIIEYLNKWVRSHFSPISSNSRPTKRIPHFIPLFSVIEGLCVCWNLWFWVH